MLTMVIGNDDDDDDDSDARKWNKTKARSEWQFWSFGFSMPWEESKNNSNKLIPNSNLLDNSLLIMVTDTKTQRHKDNLLESNKGK